MKYYDTKYSTIIYLITHKVQRRRLYNHNHFTGMGKVSQQRLFLL